MRIAISDLRARTGVGFGTSGIRDVNEKLTDKTVYLYTLSFLKQARKIGNFTNSHQVAIAGDLRTSTDKIMMAVARAITDSGVEVINCGKIPTPAVFYFGGQKMMPSIMVTGSHIPDNRNGVKFNLTNQEILKKDEEEISQMEIDVDENLFDSLDNFKNTGSLPKIEPGGYSLYLNRLIEFFGTDLLSNNRIGLYGHSAVGRELMVDLLTQMGASVVQIEFSSDDKFVAVDTDGVDEELVAKMHRWHKDHGLNYIISTDGDGDRPLLTDEDGNLVRPELIPILAGHYLGIEAMACTLTTSTAVEKSGFFKKVVRTKVGSPNVVEAMMELENEGYEKVGSFELNGGFLLQTDLLKNDRKLLKLPTRDALVAILSVLAQSKETGKSVVQLVDDLPKRFTYSLSIKGIPTETSLEMLANWQKYRSDIETEFGEIGEVNLLDGLRLTFADHNIVHFRPSKNSPEFRSYTESDSHDHARRLSEKAIELIQKWTSNLGQV